jgi:hypothetical protein
MAQRQPLFCSGKAMQGIYSDRLGVCYLRYWPTLRRAGESREVLTMLIAILADFTKSWHKIARRSYSANCHIGALNRTEPAGVIKWVGGVCL